MHTSKYLNLSQIVALELDPWFTTLKQLPDAQDREDTGAIWGRGRNFGHCIHWHDRTSSSMHTSIPCMSLACFWLNCRFLNCLNGPLWRCAFCFRLGALITQRVGNAAWRTCPRCVPMAVRWMTSRRWHGAWTVRGEVPWWNNRGTPATSLTLNLPQSPLETSLL